MTATSVPRAAVPGLSEREMAVTRHLLVHGPATRGHLGDHLQLSSASMSRVTRALVDGGIAALDIEPAPGIGRPRQILSAVPNARHVVGCKVTGHTVYGVLCDLMGNVTATAESPLPSAGRDGTVPVDETVEVVARLTTTLAAGVPAVHGLGVSVGGVVVDRSIVREGTFLGWHDVALAPPLRERTGLPVVVTNDVTALAREQLWFGAGRTHSTFGLITVGAGLGFGLVREGVVVEELIDNGHLLAHAPLDVQGPRCSIGHPGCVAAYLNRDDVERRACAAAGRPVTFDDLVAAREAGDGTAADLLDAASRALGHLVATVAGALQTPRIVLAGEDIAALAGSPAMDEVIADRLRPGPEESQRCTLDVTTEPLTFSDWARGAAVTGIQHVLGAA